MFLLQLDSEDKSRHQYKRESITDMRKDTNNIEIILFLWKDMYKTVLSLY